MAKIIIDREKCTACGACVADCFGRNLGIEDGAAKTLRPRCVECGHCVAICPVGAVSMEGDGLDDVEDVQDQTFTPDQLLNFIKTRRSIRQFQDKKVEKEKLERIIDAGRFTPTASNIQGVSYAVVQGDMPEFRQLIMQSLKSKADALLADPATPRLVAGYAKMWAGAYAQFCAAPDAPDAIFFAAPAVVLIFGNSVLDVGLAASNMELMAFAQGLGMLHSGFITRACDDQAVMSFLGANDKVVHALVLGYTDLAYHRSAPRNASKITWR